jgi:hypothetical protein
VHTVKVWQKREIELMIYIRGAPLLLLLNRGRHLVPSFQVVWFGVRRAYLRRTLASRITAALRQTCTEDVLGDDYDEARFGSAVFRSR